MTHVGRSVKTCISNACLWCYCRMDLFGTLPEGIAVNFRLIPCSIPYTRDHEHMELEKVQ